MAAGWLILLVRGTSNATYYLISSVYSTIRPFFLLPASPLIRPVPRPRDSRRKLMENSFPLFSSLLPDIQGEILLGAPRSVQILLSLASPFFFNHRHRPKIPLQFLTKAICEEGEASLIPFALSLGLSFSKKDLLLAASRGHLHFFRSVRDDFQFFGIEKPNELMRGAAEEAALRGHHSFLDFFPKTEELEFRICFGYFRSSNLEALKLFELNSPGFFFRDAAGFAYACFAHSTRESSSGLSPYAMFGATKFWTLLVQTRILRAWFSHTNT